MPRKRPAREKQPKTRPKGPLRYLLSADRKLRRLSLKKMAERAQQPKAKVRPRSRGHKAAAGAGPAESLVSASTSRMLATGAVGVIAAAVLVSAGVPSLSYSPASLAAPYETPREDVRVSARPEISAAPLVAVAVPEPAKPDVVVRTPAPVEPARSVSVPSPRPHLPASQPQPQRVVAETAPPAAAPAASTPKPDVAEPSAARVIVSPEQDDAAPVTLTGCVVFERQTFWLKDTDGAEAPRTRSWRSGFLKKRAAPVELVDVRGTLKLASHVGHRVAATGMLADREMRPRSLQRVAGSCS